MIRFFLRFGSGTSGMFVLLSAVSTALSLVVVVVKNRVKASSMIFCSRLLFAISFVTPQVFRPEPNLYRVL